MVFIKALCIVFFFYSASFGESRSLENDSNLKKRAFCGHQPPDDMSTLAQQIAQTLENDVRVAANDPSRTQPNLLGGTQQFGFIYLQPSNKRQLFLINRGVRDALTVRGRFTLDDDNNLWPRQPDNTNFRMAKVDYREDRRTNLGHSEYLLLQSDDGLARMKERLRGCPTFMLVYSTNLPCMRARYGDAGNLVPGKPDRCLEMIGNAKRQLQGDLSCPDTFVFLYTHQAAAKSQDDKDQRFFRWEKDYLNHNNIHWIHP